ncbi:hypothetical protein DFH09DRAFT_1093113 [Mycena vulgaris]|nr:hypothetical protein DFH09DRAFT_1093113 [Mycena vulgaris]
MCFTLQGPRLNGITIFICSSETNARHSGISEHLNLVQEHPNRNLETHICVFAESAPHRQGNGPGRIYMIVAYDAGKIPSEFHEIIGKILTFMTLRFGVRSRFERGAQSANAEREPGVRFSHSVNPEPERRVRFGPVQVRRGAWGRRCGEQARRDAKSPYARDAGAVAVRKCTARGALRIGRGVPGRGSASGVPCSRHTPSRYSRPGPPRRAPLSLRTNREPEFRFCLDLREIASGDYALMFPQLEVCVEAGKMNKTRDHAYLSIEQESRWEWDWIEHTTGEKSRDRSAPIENTRRGMNESRCITGGYRTASLTALEKEASILPAVLRLERALLRRIARYLTLPAPHGITDHLADAVSSAPKNRLRASPLHYVERIPGLPWPPTVPARGQRIRDRRSTRVVGEHEDIAVFDGDHSLTMEPIIPIYSPPWDDALPITTIIPTKEAAIEVLHKLLLDEDSYAATWFTDGSLLEGKAGGAAVRVEAGVQKEVILTPLGDGQVCEGEVEGIISATRRALLDEFYRILVVSDSQAALRGICSTSPRSGQFRAIGYDKLVTGDNNPFCCVDRTKVAPRRAAKRPPICFMVTSA